jgi:Protein of unknown function (DUF1207)
LRACFLFPSPNPVQDECPFPFSGLDMKRAFARPPVGLGLSVRVLLLAALHLGLITAAGAQSRESGAFPPAQTPRNRSVETIPPPEDVSPEPIPAPRAAVPSEETPPPVQAMPPDTHPLVDPQQPLVSLALDSGVPTLRAEGVKKKWVLWDEKVCLVGLPSSLLWKPPMANQREPRMFAKFSNALHNTTTIDTAIGAETGLLRLAPENPFEGIQLDLFGAVFTRFDAGLLQAADYRVGPAFTYARDSWTGKVSYEHTSAHLGDQFIDHNPGTQIRSFVRDEVVVAASRYFFDHALRFYGQIGSAFGKRHPPGNRVRYDFGTEYVQPVDLRFPGNPFAALDFDIRPEYNYRSNTTFQVGWRFIDPPTRHAVRVALEYYTGASPYGKFFRERENWFGVSLVYDW